MRGLLLFVAGLVGGLAVQTAIAQNQPAGADRPPGLTHYGVEVENMGNATAMFKQRGANVSERRVSPTKAALSNVTDPNGIRMKLLEFPAASRHRQAMGSWK